MRRKFFTIGYTGFSLPQFLNMLRECDVEVLVDIREIPLSRKRGFSKTSLAENLKTVGIEYRHLRQLGSPRALRNIVRETGDYPTFFSGVHNHLRLPASKVQLNEAIEIGRHSRACLMCCCSDWTLCHRKCVVEAVLKEAYFSFEHLRLNPCLINGVKAA